MATDSKDRESPVDSPVTHPLMRWFPEAKNEERLPSAKELREKILELHENGDKESATELLAWRDELDLPVATKRTNRLTTIIVFSLVGIIGITLAIWLFSGQGKNTEHILVCKIGAEIHYGNDCVNPKIEAPKSGNIDLPFDVQPGTTNH